MTARTHDVAALAALTVWIIAAPPESITVATGLTAVLANQLGGIAPDIDQPTAPFWRNLPVGRYLGKVFGALVGGHRFFSHSLFGFAVFSGAALLLLQFFQPIMPHIDIQFVWVAFMLGMFSHLVMDTLTKEGVPWLLPIPHKFGFPPIRAWRVTTGKKMENLVVLPALVVLTMWLCAAHYDVLTQIVQQHLVK
ncbi:metal-dependent hydrolase [Candidatus Saccharibacteria bacterium]|nr:metal-dependent hydrolase [Candidatus Saccharibacteria bacterium]